MQKKLVSHRSGSGQRRVVMAAVLLAALTAVTAAQSPRIIYPEPGVSLLSKLRSDDRVVAVPGGVERPGIDVTFMTLPAYIGLMVGGTDVGVVLDVASAAGRLTDDKSWVVTDITGTVKRVLYTSKGHIEAGERLSMTLERGGEVKIGSVTLRAGVVPNVLPGRSYLAFLNPTAGRSDYAFPFPTGRGEWYPWVGLFEVTRAQRIIDPARPCVPIPDEYFPELVMHNARTDLVLNLIREAVRQKD
jgi:hypothetical protein